MSNTRGSLSSDIQTPEKHIQKARSNILNTRKLFHIWYIQTPRSNISNTRGSVSSDIQTPSSNIWKTGRSVSSDIQTPRSNISNTRESVSFDIQTPRSNILKTKRSVLSDSQTRVNFYGSSHLMIFKFLLVMGQISITRDVPEETFAKRGSRRLISKNTGTFLLNFTSLKCIGVRIVSRELLIFNANKLLPINTFNRSHKLIFYNLQSTESFSDRCIQCCHTT